MSYLTPPGEDVHVRTVYVGGIYRGKYTPTVEEHDIRHHLNAYGQLESVRMVPKRSCAYVTFATRRAAEKAVKDLDDNLEIKGLQLKVMLGTPPPPQPPELRRPSGSPPIPIQQHCGGSSVDPPRPRPGAAVVPSSHNESVVNGSGVTPENLNLVGPDGNSAEEPPREETSFRLAAVRQCGGVVGNGASEGGVSGNPSISGEQVEPQTIPLGGAKRSLEEAMSPQEMMRETVTKRTKGPTPTPSASTSTPPAVSPQPAATPLEVGSAAVVGESSEETPVTRLPTSSHDDTLLSLMQSLETKSDVEVTEMTLKGVQALGRRLTQQDTWRQRLAEAEAAEARMSAQIQSLTDAAAAAEARAAAEIQSLKEAVAAAEARAAAVEERAAAAAKEAQKSWEAFLTTVNAPNFKK